MKRKAFTLIELLVVISIIALLMSILMPSLAKVKALARKTVCAAHMSQCGLALNMYAMENKDITIPDVIDVNSDGVSVPMPWDIALIPYFQTTKSDSSKDYVACPADKKPRKTPEHQVFEDYLSGEALARSYLQNGALENRKANNTPKWWSNQSGNAAKTTMIATPSEVLWMVECHIGYQDSNYRVQEGQPGYEGCVQGSNYWSSLWWAPTVKGFRSNYAGSAGVSSQGDQHEDGGNWLFIDGHVEWFGFDYSAPDGYHAFKNGPVYPFTWVETKNKRVLAKAAGYVD